MAIRIEGVNMEIRTIDTTHFITHVPAVVLVVTLAAAMDAGAITAFKFVRTAGGMCWGNETDKEF